MICCPCLEATSRRPLGPPAKVGLEARWELDALLAAEIAG
jgi:hypothetical protein